MIGQEIKNKRLDAKITLCELASLIQIKVETLERIESGKINPRQAIVNKINNIFKCNLKSEKIAVLPKEDFSKYVVLPTFVFLKKLEKQYKLIKQLLIFNIITTVITLIYICFYQ